MNDKMHDLVISRLIKAPRAIVWKAWTTPEHLKEWWCPKPWTTQLRGFDLRPGGVFDTLMRGPDGPTDAPRYCHVVSNSPARTVATAFSPSPCRIVTSPFFAR